MNLVGVVALSNPHEVILGLEVKMDAVNRWRKKCGLSPISNPNISCCYLCKEVFDEILETIVFEETGKMDRYIVWVKGGGTREIKNEKEKRYQAEKKEKKDEKKIEKWYQ